MWKLMVAGCSLVLAVGCGAHGAEMMTELDALALEVEAYHHEVDGATTMAAARSAMVRHEVAARARLDRLRRMSMGMGMGMGMGMDGDMGLDMGTPASTSGDPCSMCPDLHTEMEAHRTSMEEATNAQSMRAESDRHRDAMGAWIDAMRRHIDGMGRMMMGGGGH